MSEQFSSLANLFDLKQWLMPKSALKLNRYIKSNGKCRRDTIEYQVWHLTPHNRRCKDSEININCHPFQMSEFIEYWRHFIYLFCPNYRALAKSLLQGIVFIVWYSVCVWVDDFLKILITFCDAFHTDTRAQPVKTVTNNEHITYE